MKTRVQISIIVLLFLYWVTPGVNAQVHYVNWIAAGSGDGSSWNNAFTDLQAAIDAASQDDSIWVAEGIYLPTHILGSDTLRGATFYFSKAVNVFGGFEGLSGSEGNFEARDSKLHETIMSGDVGILGDVADNTFHVVYFDKVSDSTRLEGFIIRDGNSLNVGGLDGLGAGVFNNADGGRSHPVLVNCDIRDNHAIESGGGFWNYATNGGKQVRVLSIVDSLAMQEVAVAVFQIIQTQRVLPIRILLIASLKETPHGQRMVVP